MHAISVFSVVLMIIALSLLFRAAGRIEEENRMLEAGIQTSRIYNEALQSRIGEIRRLRHDAAGLLQAIDEYGADAGDGPAERKAAEGPAASKTAMPLLEAVIELKRRQCAAEGIAFDCPGEFPGMPAGLQDRDLTLPDETDLCLLMQNLLDNAYEANLRIDDRAKRFMRLETVVSSGGSERGGAAALTITVSNRVSETEKVTFITRKNQAELHGIGLRIVDDILKKYNGGREVSTDNAQHILTTAARMTAGRDEKN